MAMVADFENDSDDSKSLFVCLGFGIFHEKSMYEVKFQVVLDTINPMLSWGMEVDMVGLVSEWAFSIHISDLDASNFASGNLHLW
jgi:hypothetical protein